MGATEQMAMCFDAIQKIRAEIPNPDLRIRLGVEGFVQDTWKAQKQVIERDFRAQREAAESTERTCSRILDAATE